MNLLTNYLRTALRNLLRHKSYTLINLVGMSIGLTAVVLLTAYVNHEVGYDQQHTTRDQVYRVLRRTTSPAGATDVSTSVSGALGAAALETLPQVEQTVRVWDGRKRERRSQCRLTTNRR